MAYDEAIASEILDLVNSAPKGVSTHYLKHFDQEDVADTVNELHHRYPETIRDTCYTYDDYVTIEIEK